MKTRGLRPTHLRLVFCIAAALCTIGDRPASADGGATAATPAFEAGADQPRRTLHRRSETSASAERAVPDAPSTGSAGLTNDRQTGAFSLAWPLCAVLGLIGLGVAVVRRWLPGAAAQTSGGGGILVLSRQHLSAKQSLCLVRLGRRIVLVGITPERISTLSEILDADEAAAVVAAVERAKPGSFSTMFGKLAGRGSGLEAERLESEEPDRAAASNGSSGTQDPVRRLIDRVRSLSAGMDASAEPI